MLDSETLQVATPSCPATREEVLRGRFPADAIVRTAWWSWSSHGLWIVPFSYLWRRLAKTSGNSRRPECIS